MTEIPFVLLDYSHLYSCVLTRNRNAIDLNVLISMLLSLGVLRC
ncbi:hypothetical protein HanXRQr2_Chr11g0507261 [Helianthus annuus]|uniref:Uncharacterized protein n=1 Tax=Helianthus annuus TaxID=4232 RepID=A0A9K3N1C5_HELAN|nr:hypothetical protein HanXRQr2_Chr11g0507261 [Helianthus annuus]